MTESQEIDFWRTLERELAEDDGAAAMEHLAAGNPIYYRTSTTPKGVVEKKFPDGRRQLVRWDLAGEHVVLEYPSAPADS